MKHCPKCNKEKPFEAFYASSTHKSGYASWCKECESERNRLKTQKYRDSRLVKAKQWRDENKDKQAVAIRAWREQNFERKNHVRNYHLGHRMDAVQTHGG